MIILDTNVLSEPTRPSPSQAVATWLRAQRQSELFTTTISEAEMRGGLAGMHTGRHRTHLVAMIESIFMQEFAGRILDFGRDAARAFPAVITAMGRKPGPIVDANVLIAAIALAHGAPLATRNVKDFAHCGIPLINPWTG